MLNIKKIRNVIIVIGIMIALLPWFFYFFQDKYYGAGFSLTTTSLTIVAFIAAALLQVYDNKRNGRPLLPSILIVCGFTALFIYLRFFL